MVKTQTFVTNPDGAGSLRRSNGFTLIELLVVLAIASLLLALVPVAYSKAIESAQYRSVLKTLIAEMRLGRQVALTSGQSSILALDLAKREFGLIGKKTHDLPASLTIRATVGSEQLTQAMSASIVFMPDGGCTGGSVDVLRPGGGGTRVRVHWLTGEVTQERLTP